MKSQALKILPMLSLVLMLTAISVRAQSERSGFLNIPFNFTVDGKTLRAGEYTVAPNRRDFDKVWLIQSRDGLTTILFTTLPLQSPEIQEQTKLIFHKYGDQYFLAQIWTPGGNSGRELPMNHREREMAKNAVERQPISLAGGPPKRN